MAKHAICSASAAHRWMHCTAAPRYEEQFPNGSSSYASEGTLAHELCEYAGAKVFGRIDDKTFKKEVRRLKKSEYWNDEMLKTSDFYAQYLFAESIKFDTKPFVGQEIRVDFSEYVPEGFGTCDCLMVGGTRIKIIDYKHGKGVEVSAEYNPQMMLYALGALNYVRPIFGDTITDVDFAIVQPRITENVAEWHMTVEELKAWGENEAKPAAQKAFYGMGDFAPGEWCRFCKGKAECRARAEYHSAFADFKDLFPAKSAEPQSPRLTLAEIGRLLTDAADLPKWYEDLKEYATQRILAGDAVPGWKVVAGRSTRKWSDEDAALDAIKKAGWDDAMLYERKNKTLAELEKMIGKTDFAAIAGKYITKPMGAPTLTTAADKREPYSQAAADFKNIV